MPPYLLRWPALEASIVCAEDEDHLTDILDEVASPTGVTWPEYDGPLWVDVKADGPSRQRADAAIRRHGIEPGKLVVHQDRGAPMTAHGFAELLAQLGVDRSYSRPHVSNDNRFSESQFHTLKYQPDYPGRFHGARHGRHWCGEFFDWHNHDQHHEGLCLFTPADVFFGRVEFVAAQRLRANPRTLLLHVHHLRSSTARPWDAAAEASRCGRARTDA